jgi:undecaprenyl-diphosphatase
MMELISRLNHWEASLIRRLVPETHAAWTDAVMIGLTRVGDGWLWGAVALAALQARSLRAFAAGALACGTANLVFVVMKRTTGRERPCHAHRDLRAPASARDYYSFPSGHSMNAFAATTVLEAVVWPSAVPLLLVIAFGVAVSRVYLRLHYPTDVLVGALLGRVLGATALAAIL